MMVLSDTILSLKNRIDLALSELAFPGAPAGLYEPMRYSLNAPGKRLRPILTLLAGTALGAEAADLMPAALAVEILHTFSLVHDDIMDNATQRRGRPTLQIKWDNNTALLAGDGLMALAFQTLMQTESNNIRRMGAEFSQAMLEICEGQALDVEFERRPRVTPAAYLEMVGKKTGRLLALCGQLAALYCQAEEAVVNAFYHFGREIGQAFQIQDDVLELTSDAKTMGKSLTSDLAAGKKTLPVVLMTEGMTTDQAEQFLVHLKENCQNRQAVSQLFEERGVLQVAHCEADRLFESARARLAVLPAGAQEPLVALVGLIRERRY